VMPGAHGSHLGQIDLRLHYGAQGWAIKDWEAKVLPISRRCSCGKLASLAEEDPALVALLAEAHAKTRAQMRKVVGHSPHELHSYFTLFGEDRGLALVARAQISALKPVLAGTTAENLPLLSAVSPGKFGGRSGPECFTDIPAGELCLRNVADLQIFPNELWVVVVSGARLKDWLEMSAGLFNQIPQGGEDVDLINPDRAGHNFDVLFGLEYEIDVSQPPRFSSSGLLINPQAQRIRNLRCRGLEVAPNQHFAVATSSYRISGGGNFRMVQEATRLQLPKLRIRDAICDYVAKDRSQDPLNLSPYPWKLAALGGARVRTYTAPIARARLHEFGGHQEVEEQRVTPGGFLELALRL